MFALMNVVDYWSILTYQMKGRFIHLFTGSLCFLVQLMMMKIMMKQAFKTDFHFTTNKLRVCPRYACQVLCRMLWCSEISAYLRTEQLCPISILFLNSLLLRRWRGPNSRRSLLDGTLPFCHKSWDPRPPPGFSPKISINTFLRTYFKY